MSGGLRYILGRGPDDARFYVERVADGADRRMVAWWTGDEDRAHRFATRREAEAARVAIMAEEPFAVLLIPEA